MSDHRKENPEWINERNQLRISVCNGDQHALMFLSALMDSIELWDDMIDQDAEISSETINRVFMNLLFWLPQNPFFEKNKMYLLPLVMTCINAWMDANEWQKSPVSRCRQAAWWLKQMGVEMYSSVAFLTGGFNHMRRISLQARKILMHEDFADFEQENIND